MKTRPSLDTITAFAKRRGFVYPSSSIYGGLANTWDYGHYGIQLKKNISDLWWRRFVQRRDDMVGIEASIFLNPKVWEASGHVASFTDAMVDCKNCQARTRADHLIEEAMKGAKVEGLTVEELTKIISENKLICPKCGKSDFTDVRLFNLLFETKLGIIEGDKSQLFLRGELAQGIFINFKNVLDTMRVRVPFGIAQQGKVFRNEITMGQFVHRTMEFDLMELEYFIHPSTWEQTFSLWQEEMMKFVTELGISSENIRWREHEEFERSHYSTRTADIEYNYPFGWKELFGLAYRTDFDLKNHQNESGKSLEYTDPMSGEKYIPHVVEPTFGLSRLLGVMLFECYEEQELENGTRVVLHLPVSLAPVKVAVFPLQKDERLQKLARFVYDGIKHEHAAEFDDSGNIGKMYRRQDEIGTPLCITVDFDSLETREVTVRDRDTMKQETVAIDQLSSYLAEKLSI